MILKKIILSVILLLLISQSIHSAQNYISDNVDSEPTFSENNSIDNSKRLTPEKLDASKNILESTPQIESATIVDNQKYQGESVLVEYAFQYTRILSGTGSGYGTVTEAGDNSLTYVNDGSEYSFTVTSRTTASNLVYTDTTPSASCSGGAYDYMAETYYQFSMPAIFEGDLSIDARVHTTDTASNTFITSTTDIAINTDYIDYESQINVAIVAQVDGDGGFSKENVCSSLTVYVLNIVTYAWDQMYLATDTIIGYNPDVVSNFILGLDYISYKPDQIQQQIRSEYHYSETTIVKSLDFEVLENNVKIAIYSSDTMTSVTPIRTFSFDSTSETWNFTSSIAATYSVILLSNSTNFLALEDVTSDYLDYPSFEGSSSDWEESSSNPFTDISLDTSIVSEGAYSLKLSDSSSYGLLYLKPGGTNIEDGYYYFSFDIYIENLAAENNNLYWYQDSAWVVNNLPTELNRWHKQFYYVNMRDGLSNNVIEFYFRDAASTMIVYLDNFHIFKASGSVEPVDLNEYQLQSKFTVWDGYQNPAYTNKDVELSLRDRTADTEIKSWSLTTDSQGVATTTLSASLEQKEYELKSWSYDSWFLSGGQIDHRRDLTYYSATGSISGYTEVIESDYTKLSFTTSGTWYLWYGHDTSPQLGFDITSADYLVTETKISDASLSTWNTIYLGTGSNGIQKPYTYSASTDWKIDYMDLSSFSTFGTPNLDAIEAIHWKDTYQPATLIFYIRDVHFVQAQKYYFTPQPSSDLPYSYEQKQDKSKNYWDFTENTIEDWNDYSTPTVSNGKVYYSTTGTTLRVRESGLSIDTSYYDTIVVRVKSNASTADWYTTLTVDSVTYSPGSLNDFTGDDNWQIFEIDLTQNVNYLGSLTYFSFRHETGSKKYVEIDYINFVHKEASTLYETDDSFFLSSINDTRSYYVEQDNFWGYFTDLEYIYKNLTAGTHSLNILQIFDTSINAQLTQIPESTWTNTTYEIIDDFIVSVYDFSLSDDYVQTYVTATKDFTYQIYENNTLIASGSGNAEGTSIQSLRDNTNGVLIEYAIKITNSSDSVWFNSSYSNAAAVAPDVLILYLTEFNFDAAGGYIYFNWQTNWENTTAYVYDNGTLLGSGPETSLVVSFATDLGWHNISILVKNVATTEYTLSTSFTISTTAYEVDIDIFDGVGLGIPFDTVKIYANVSGSLVRIPESFYWFNSSINLVVMDYFNVTLLTQEYDLQSNLVNYLDLQLSIFSITIQNSYEVDVRFIVKRNSRQSSFIIPANSTLLLRLTSGSYTFIMEEYYEKTYGEIAADKEYVFTYSSTQANYAHSKAANYRVYLRQRSLDEPGSKFDLSKIQIVLFLLSIIGGALTVRTVKREVEKKGWSGFFKSFLS